MKKVDVKIFINGKNTLPEYSHFDDAGFDIRADLSKIEKGADLIGNNRFSFLENEIIIRPGGRVLVPTNIHVSVPTGYEMQIRPRSGLALKNGITVVNSPGTIDPSYRGSIGMILLNTDMEYSFAVKHGDRIAQGVLNETIHCEWGEVSKIEDLGESDRGQGGYGHTGVK